VTLRQLLWPTALILLTLLYNIFEGAASIVAGLSASSLVLVAFGFDSYLEVLAAAAVLWRLSCKDQQKGERAEQRALRLIGGTFLLFAGATVLQAALSLAEREGASESLLGLGLLTASLVLMPALSLAKLWLASHLQMPVLAAEAKETLACVYLSATALSGLVAVYIAGWWWIHSVAALIMVPWLLKEGLEAVRGDHCFEEMLVCFCRRRLYGLRTCAGACCTAAA
jgi:divalent metal cation (Fe/Co/Zn/Cd) transporter